MLKKQFSVSLQRQKDPSAKKNLQKRYLSAFFEPQRRTVWNIRFQPLKFCESLRRLFSELS
jgi:hypothetical protein